MDTLDGDRHVLLSVLALEIAQAYATARPEHWADGKDSSLRKAIVAALNFHGSPDPAHGIPEVLPHILRLVRDGAVHARSTFNDLPPHDVTDLSEVQAHPDNWYVTRADADVLLRQLGLGRVVEKRKAFLREEADQLAERRAAGRYTLDEVALELKTHSEIGVARWRELIAIAASKGAIHLRNPYVLADVTDYPVSARLRTFAQLANMHPADRGPLYEVGDQAGDSADDKAWHPATHLEHTTLEEVNRWLDMNPALTTHRLAMETDGVTSASEPRGVSKRAVLAVEWPVKIDMARALQDVPKWLVHARVSRGRPGSKASATWNPVLVAVCVHEQHKVSKAALRRLIARHFGDWLDEWDEKAKLL